MQEAQQHLHQRRDEWVQIVNAGDLEGYVGLFSENAVWLPPGQTAVAGRPAIREWLTPFFKQFHYNFSIENEQIRIAGDWAIERGTFHSELTRKEGGEPMRHSGKYVVLWHRGEDGLWHIDRYLDVTEIDA